MIAALFVQKNGVYFGLPEVDPWDEERDARLYMGPWSVIAHPPCSRWCSLAPINQKRYGHKVGDDGGCFTSALRCVNHFGGVLEHPSNSLAWRAFNLPLPRRGRWIYFNGAWVTEVNQGTYGHPAEKPTWLYYCGLRTPPPLNWEKVPPSATVSFFKNKTNTRLRRLKQREAAATPPEFRDLLIALAKHAGPREDQGVARELVNPGQVNAAGETPSSESALRSTPRAVQGSVEHGEPEGDTGATDGDAPILAEAEPEDRTEEPNATKRKVKPTAAGGSR